MRLNSEVLRSARQIIGEFGWCQRANARDAKGHACRVLSPEAREFSLYGAVLKASRAGDADIQQTALFESLTQLTRVRLRQLGWTEGETHQHPVFAFNDFAGIDKAAIVALLDEAIQEHRNTEAGQFKAEMQTFP
jgi:hypothetical protein